MRTQNGAGWSAATATAGEHSGEQQHLGQKMFRK
jgi:hypothetical protein